jgi:hypothetical protein
MLKEIFKRILGEKYRRISQERLRFHEFQKKFKSYLKPGYIIYDIGKDPKWDYKKVYQNYKYFTVDNNPEVSPDILDDIEETHLSESCDALICWGVTEQCNNAYKLLEGISKILKPNGLGLFGIISVGYPIYGKDFVRFTPQGAIKLLSDFDLLEKEIVYRKGVPSYVIAICRKK